MDNKTKYLIIGNSTAAVGAVEGLRRVDRETPIVLLAKEPHHTYSRPLISYLLAGEVDTARMYYRSADFYEKNGVDARLGVEVERVDPEKRIATTTAGMSVSFEKLLIATGGKPFVPPMEGSDARGVFTFTAWDDAKRMAAYIEETSATRAVVIGGGLIGIKAAEALHARGFTVTMIELGPRVLPLALDETASRLAAEAISEAGVELVCETTVDRIVAPEGRVAGVVLKTGREIDCDLVVVAIGVIPDTDIVKDSSIKVERGIVIDERCETNVKGIYAAGDVAQGMNALTGESRPIPIFPNAYRQGGVAGANMAGGERKVDASFPMNSVDVFGLPTISVGLATVEGEDYDVLTRIDKKARSYKRIVLRDSRVVGALTVGDIDRAGIFTGLIRERVDISSARDLLLSDEFGLVSLPAEYRKHVVRGEGIEV
jgi:NAD(P)H-nitrite reductase large subunit